VANNWPVMLWMQFSPLGRGLLLLWLLTMLSLPALIRTWGERIRTYVIIASVLLQAATIITILLPVWGATTTLRSVALVLVLGWLAEFVGSKTGIPFGRYHYTQRLQPQLGGVPLLIPVAWLMMLAPAWAVGAAITGSGRGMGFVVASALAFTAWDLFLDPQMVAWGLWVWPRSEVRASPPAPDRAAERRPGLPHRARTRGFFGIPWSNYAGWLVVSALITWIAVPAAALPTPAGTPLITIYGLVWVLETVGQLVFWHLTGPGLTGGVVMGSCLLWALLKG